MWLLVILLIGFLFELLNPLPLNAAENLVLESMREAANRQRLATNEMRRAIAAQLRSVAAQRVRTIPGPAEREMPAAEPCARMAEEEMGRLIEAAAGRERLHPELLHAVIRQESGYAPCAVSPRGAAGLMQLMPGTAADMGVDNPFDVQQNLYGGARFLRLLLDRYDGNLPLALGAYNAGPARVDALQAVPRIPETMDYVRRILGFLGSPAAEAYRQPAATPGSSLR
jgi:soluble lytic murein transglycosylase-like protein